MHPFWTIGTLQQNGAGSIPAPTSGNCPKALQQNGAGSIPVPTSGNCLTKGRSKPTGFPPMHDGTTWTVWPAGEEAEWPSLKRGVAAQGSRTLLV